MQATRSHRGLSTARAALSVTWLLARTPDGVRADEVAHELGKSVSTAYNLLASLCDEGVAERLPGGLYHLSDEFRETVAEESDRHDLSGVVDDLLARTHKRAYLAVLRGNQLRVVLERGLQGMPKLPGMNPEISDNAHALALGKIVLARAPADALERYLSAGLKRFTPDTITDPGRAAHRSAARAPRPASRPIARRSPPTSAALPRRCWTSSGASSAPSASRCRCAPSTPSARPSRRPCATSSNSKHVRIVAKFLIAVEHQS